MTGDLNQSRSHWTERRVEEEERRWGDWRVCVTSFLLFSAKFVSLYIVLSLYLRLPPSAFEATVNTGVFAFTPGAPRAWRDTEMTPAKFSFLF